MRAKLNESNPIFSNFDSSSSAARGRRCSRATASNCSNTLLRMDINDLVILQRLGDPAHPFGSQVAIKYYNARDLGDYDAIGARHGLVIIRAITMPYRCRVYVNLSHTVGEVSHSLFEHWGKSPDGLG